MIQKQTVCGTKWTASCNSPQVCVHFKSPCHSCREKCKSDTRICLSLCDSVLICDKPIRDALRKYLIWRGFKHLWKRGWIGYIHTLFPRHIILVGGNEFNALSKRLFMFREYQGEREVIVNNLRILFKSSGLGYRTQYAKLGMVGACLIPRLKKKTSL